MTFRRWITNVTTQKLLFVWHCALSFILIAKMRTFYRMVKRFPGASGLGQYSHKCASSTISGAGSEYRHRAAGGSCHVSWVAEEALWFVRCWTHLAYGLPRSRCVGTGRLTSCEADPWEWLDISLRASCHLVQGDCGECHHFTHASSFSGP